MNDIAQYYQILGVTPSTSPADIQQAYRNLAKVWHPDRFFDDPTLRYQAEVKIKEINQAYEIIKRELERITNSAKLTSRSTPKFHYQQGVIFAVAQKYQQAITEFTLAIKLNGNYIEAYQYRGFILAKLGYNLRANADFKKATDLKLSKTIHTRPETVYYNQKEKFIVCKRTIEPFKKSVSCIVISRDSSFFATGGQDNKINLWQLNNQQLICTLQGHIGGINCLAISPDDRFLISGSQDKTIKIWDLKQRKIILSLGRWLNGHTKAINSLGINFNDNTLISGGADNAIKIWDLETGAEIRNITSSLSTVTCLAISPDGHIFCSGGLEKQLRIRNATSGTVIRSLRGNCGVLSLVFSPDSNLLATGGFNCNIALWDVTTGKQIYTLSGHSDRVSTMAFLPDGKTLISGSWDGKIKLWNLKIGQEITTLSKHYDKILSIAIAPNGKSFISSSADRTIKIWELNQQVT